MRRRRLFISLGLILGFVLLVLIGLAGMVKREPAWYARATIEPGEARADQSREAVSQFSRISTVLGEPIWDVKFTADQINAFFQEDYLTLGGDDNLPEGWHAPRVMIEDDKLRLAVRVGSGLWSSILSMEVRVWKVPGQINTLALEIVSLQAGGLPLSSSTWLDDITQWARRWNVDVSWYRKEGHPVGVMRFQADQPRPTFQFDSVDLADGALTVAGRSTDPFGSLAPKGK